MIFVKKMPNSLAFETKNELSEGFIAITEEQYVKLLYKQLCFNEDGELVPYITTEKELLLDNLKKEEAVLLSEISKAKSELSAKDYVGRKISEVLLYGTAEEIESIRVEYSEVIANAKVLRDTVNEKTEKLKVVQEKLSALSNK